MESEVLSYLPLQQATDMNIEAGELERRSVSELRRAGAKLVYPEARVSRDGSLYNFVHPKSAHGVLLELVQRRAKPI